MNGWLVERGCSPSPSSVIGLVVEIGCSYFESVAFPDALEAGIVVAHLGRSSVRYGSGSSRQELSTRRRRSTSSHVYVDRRPAAGGDSAETRSAQRP